MQVQKEMSTADSVQQDPQRLYTSEEIASHNKEGDLWVIINDKVFDLTTYADTHPGGKKVLLKEAGSDATKKFLKYHRPYIMDQHGDALCIGVVKKNDSSGKGFWQKVRSSLFH